VTSFWSLNYEEQFYLVMAVGILLATTKRIPLIASVLLLSLIGLVWNWAIPGNWVCGFFIEYWTHFAFGSILYYVLCTFADLRSRCAFVGLVAILALACASRLLPWTAHSLTDKRALIELAFLSAVTLSLFFQRPFSTRITGSFVWRPVAALGTISYSLYLIHQFNLNLIAGIAQHVLPVRTPHFLMIVAMVALHVALATAFWYLCERPFFVKKGAVPLIEPHTGEATGTV